MNTIETLNLPESKLVKSQFKTFSKTYKDGKDNMRIVATVRYDDECGNGHNSFSITGETWRNNRHESCGCIHDEIAKHFPDLAPYIKWHLFDSQGPMHYVANALWFAGDRDCWGLKKGEFRQHTSRGPRQNGGVDGVPNWVLEIPDREKRDVYSATKPAPVMLEWQPYGKTGEGKAREFDLARSVAVWPEATDEQLSAEPEELKAMLLARLPALVTEFKAAIESLGFVY